MTTPNFVETPPPQSVPASSWRPADYYSGPTPERAFPVWVTFGCGGLALLIMLIVFAAGAWISGGGFTVLMDVSMGVTMGQLRGMYEKDVTAEQKQALDAEIKAVRQNLSADKLRGANLQPLLQSMSKAGTDEKVTRAEVEEMLAAARKVNESKR